MALIQSPLNVTSRINFRFEIEDFGKDVDPKIYNFYRMKWKVLMKEVKSRVKDKYDYSLLPDFRDVIDSRKKQGNPITASEIASKIESLSHTDKSLTRLIVDVSSLIDRTYTEQLAYVLVAVKFNVTDF